MQKIIQSNTDSKNSKKSFSIKNLIPAKKKKYKAAELNGLEINQMKSVKIKGKDILICRSEHGYHSFTDKCPYKGTPLSTGLMIDSTIVCLKCGTHYDVTSGRKKSGISKKDLEVHIVEEREEGIFIIF